MIKFKDILILSLFPIAGSIFCACNNGKQQTGLDVTVDSDSIRVAEVIYLKEREPLPCAALASVDELEYSVTFFDTLTDGTIDYKDQVMWDGMVKDAPTMYDGKDGFFTFRGTLRRDANFGGRVKGEPTQIVKVWTFDTYYDGSKTVMGSWGGGSGWTGEPVYVKWPKERMEAFRATSPALLDDFSDEEIIVGSLCSKVYFINWKTGTESRKPLDVTNPIKGSVSLDPSLNGNLYVGQGVPKVYPMGQMAWDLNTHRQTFFSGYDKNAWVKWGAFDSSPVRVGKFLFWPGENGTLYKYLIHSPLAQESAAPATDEQPSTTDRTGKCVSKIEPGLTLHSTLRYKYNRRAGGTENSICVYKNYGWFGNNNGNVLCVDLNTMQPIWHYNNGDDIDASIVCEVIEDVPYLYCGSEVDRQGMTGSAHFVKLNGLTGEVVWKQDIPCKKLDLFGKHFDGGFYATPLLGKGDCDSLLFANVCQRGDSKKAEFTAFSRASGEVVYRVQLNNFAWSSPVGFLNEKDKFFVFAGDASGRAYLIEGKTGRVIYEEKMCNNFESSPVVAGNQLVVGSRGTSIIKYEIR